MTEEEIGGNTGAGLAAYGVAADGICSKTLKKLFVHKVFDYFPGASTLILDL